MITAAHQNILKYIFFIIGFEERPWMIRSFCSGTLKYNSSISTRRPIRTVALWGFIWLCNVFIGNYYTALLLLLLLLGLGVFRSIWLINWCLFEYSFAEMGIPMVLNVIVGSTWESAGYERPTVTKKRMKMDNEVFFVGCDVSSLDSRLEIVFPS